MGDEDIKHLGPLAALAGFWEGNEGVDVAPSPERALQERHYRERITFEPFGPVDNHEQILWGLRYATTAWPLGEGENEDDPFHEEVGYWLWDPQERQVLRCFLVPRGVTVLAGGTVEPDAREFELVATVGSQTYGICSNEFLDREFKTVRYELKVTVHDDGRFSYEEDTQLQLKGQSALFHHTDRNTLKKVES